MSTQRHTSAKGPKAKPRRRPRKPDRKTRPRDDGRHPGGRPPLYDDPEVMAKAMDAYFADCDAHFKTECRESRNGDQITVDIPDPLPYTVSALARWLGFESTQALRDCEKRDEFTALIKKARLRIEAQDETRLKQGKGGAGLIFTAKNRHGWTDRQSHEVTAGQPIPVELLAPVPVEPSDTQWQQMLKELRGESGRRSLARNTPRSTRKRT